MSDFNVYSGQDLLNIKSEDDKYIVEDILWEKDVVFLVGDAKAGKSILSMQIACSLTSGDPFLKTYEVYKPCSVLYVQMEGSLYESVSRMKEMVYPDMGINWEPSLFNLLYCKSLSLDTQEGMNSFMSVIDKMPVKPEVIFIDPLYMAMQGDLIDNQASRQMVKNLRIIKDTLNCVMVILHHEHRQKRDREGMFINESGSQSIFGSFVWRAFASHVISLKKRDDGVRILSCDTQRSGKVIENIELRMIQPHPLQFELVGDEQNPYVMETLECIKNNGAMLVKDIITKSKLSRSAVTHSLCVLQKDKKIHKVDPKRRPALYTITKE